MRLAFALLMLAGCDLVFDLPDKGSPPFLDDYTARKSIDIRLGSTTPLDNLPFKLQFDADPDLVNITPGVFEFTDADGITTLAYEIEHYDAATGDLLVWVKLPRLDNNRLYLYYEGPQTPGRNPRQTWSEMLYSGVWHFSEGGMGLNDSTGANASFELVTSLPNEATDCQIGPCRRFEKDEDLTIDPISEILDFGDTSFSFSLWVNASGVTHTQGTPLARGSMANGGWGIVLGQNTWLAGVSAGGGNKARANFSTDPPFDEWTHLVAVVDREIGALRTYVNGAFANEASVDDLGTIDINPSENDLDISRPDPERYVARSGSTRSRSRMRRSRSNTSWSRKTS